MSSGNIANGDNNDTEAESSTGIGSNTEQQQSDSNENINTDKGAEECKEDNFKEEDKEKDTRERGGGAGSNTNGRDDGKRNDEATPQLNPAFDNKVMQKFVIDFKIRSTSAATIGHIHKQFIQEVLTVAPNTSF